MISSALVYEVRPPGFNATVEVAGIYVTVHGHSLPALGECGPQIWNDMTRHGSDYYEHNETHVKEFIARVGEGLTKSLLLNEGPPLLVAHGGVHWAICTLLAISEHDWIIDNCLPVHFYPDDIGCWKARKLI